MYVGICIIGFNLLACPWATLLLYNWAYGSFTFKFLYHSCFINVMLIHFLVWLAAELRTAWQRTTMRKYTFTSFFAAQSKLSDEKKFRIWANIILKKYFTICIFWIMRKFCGSWALLARWNFFYILGKKRDY